MGWLKRVSLAHAFTTSRAFAAVIAASAVILLTSLLPRGASAATLCVNPSGTGGCYASIQAALNAASPGDTVSVGPGTYTEHVSIATPVTLTTASGPGVTTIQGYVTITSSNTTISGFTITNRSETTIHDAYGIYLPAGGSVQDNVVISSNVITDIGTLGPVAGYNKGIGVQQGTNIGILDNTISYVSAMSVGTSHHSAMGIVIGDGSDATKDYITIRGNDVGNIAYPPPYTWDSSFKSGGAYGIIISRASGHVVIRNNTIHDLEGFWAHGIGLESDTPGAVVEGNTVTGLTGHMSPSASVAVQIESPNASAGTISVHSNNFSSVSVGVNNATSLGPVDATNNWWGQPSGPTLSANPGGTGDASSGNVSFSPWCATSACTSFNGLATRLVFATQPGGAVAGAAVDTQPIVRAEDASGNPGYNFNGAVTLGVGTNPASGTLSGTTTVNAVNGVATFSGLSIDLAGVGYTLVASATVPTASPTTQSATSASFDVAALPPPMPLTSNWESAGGVLADVPGAVTFNNKVCILVRGADDALYIECSAPASTNATGLATATWTRVGGTFQGSPSAVNRNGVLYVFVQGVDNQLYLTTSTDGTNFTTWQSFGGGLTSAPAATMFGNRIYVVARGADNAAWSISSDDGVYFTPWTSLGGVLTAAPAVTSANGELFVAVKGADNALYLKRSSDGATFTDWRNLGGVLVGAPAATGYQGQLYLFVQGADNALYEQHTANSVDFTGWRSLGGVLTAAPTAATLTDNGGNETLYVFVRGLDNSLWEMHTLP